MKKLWLLVALLLCLALTCATAEKEPTLYISGDFAYTLLEDGTAEITYYVGEATSLVIPSSLNRYSVTSIGDAAFHNRNSLTSITIPDSIVSMGGNPFGYCRNLTTIKVSPDHPVFATIDGVLFDKTEKKLICYPYAFTAEFYSIPQGILSIGKHAFYKCNSLTSITIPDSVTFISDFAFSSCGRLTSITIPSSVTYIGDGAFSSCDSLTSVVIPNSVVSLGSNPFLFCDNLTAINVSPDHPVFATIDGILFDKTEKKLICYPRAFTAELYSIPQGILSIGDDAFYYCDSLTSITIPDSITSIGDDAFSECLNLKSITVPRDSYAAQYCKDNDLPYTYPDANDWLLN